MRKLTSFPMEKLCYDLKLEVLEETLPEETIELIKVNAGFRSILLRTPWIVFGHHVARMDFGSGGWVLIEKDYGDMRQFDTDLHFPLMKRIHSCNSLSIDLGPKEFIDTQAMILNQLKYQPVKCLTLCGDGFAGTTNETNFRKFLENFRSMIEIQAFIHVDIELLIQNQVISSLFENFIANQMNDCESVDFFCHSVAAFHFYIDAFAKTSIKCMILLRCSDHFEDIVRSIVEKRIPRKNLKTAFRLLTNYSQERNAPIIDLLSQFPGIKRFDGKNKQEVIEMLGELGRKHLEPLALTNIIFFQRKIDSSMDYVYMLSSSFFHTGFFAFYVQPRSEMMES